MQFTLDDDGKVPLDRRQTVNLTHLYGTRLPGGEGGQVELGEYDVLGAHLVSGQVAGMQLTHAANDVGIVACADDDLGRSSGMLHAGQGFGRSIADRARDST